MAQKVHVGTTQSGIVGLFTGRTLAWSLPEGWESWTYDQLIAYCDRLGFELTDPRPPHDAVSAE